MSAHEYLIGTKKMFKKFILNLGFVKTEIASANKTVSELTERVDSLKSQNNRYIKAINELDIQIQNYEAAGLELQQEQKEHLEIINTLKIKNTGLEKMIKEQENILNEDDNGQIKNLKAKIIELQAGVEELKQINFEKNQEINKLLAQ